MSRVRADKFVNRAATGAPELTYGAQVVTGYGITGAGGINISGVVTATGGWGGTLAISDTTDSTSSTTGAFTVAGGVGIAKSLFVGNNVTIGGTVTYEDVTNVDSVGIITAQTGVIVTAGRGLQVTAGGLNVDAGIGTFDAGVKVTAGGIDVTAGGLKITAGVTTFSNEVTAAGGVDVTGGVKVGAALTVVGALDVDGATTVDALTVAETATFSQGVNVGGGITMSTAGITTFSKAVYFNDGLLEQCVIVANKLSAVNAIDIEQGNVWYYSTNETTTATPNIRWNGSVALDDRLKVGETVNVSIISKPNGAGYYAALNVDGSGVTEEWLGGSAPSSANSGGYDILTHQLIKTGTDTWICLSNVVNFA